MKKFLLVAFFGLAVHSTSKAQSLEWALNLQLASQEFNSITALDTFGNIYVSGIFTGTADFDPGPGVTSYTASTMGEIFIVKYDKNGNYKWAKHLDGTSSAEAYSMVTDDTSNIYITGNFAETVDFDPGVDPYNLTSTGSNDIFFVKLDSSGSFKMAKQIGGSGYDEARSITLDDNGNIYLTGNFVGTVDFDPDVVDVSNLISAGYDDIFVTKFNSGGYFQWAKRMGGNSLDFSNAIAVDASGNIYTTGWFLNTMDADPGSGTANLIATGSSWNCFVSKLDNNGNYIWGKQLSGNNFVGGESIGLDASGNVFVGGGFMQTADFDPGAATLNMTSAGSEDVFLAKLNSSGDLIWAKSFGGTDSEKNYALKVDESGSVVMCGTFKGTVDFDPGVGTANFTAAGVDNWEDYFVTHLDANGNHIWTKQTGGTVGDIAYDLAIDPDGFVYVTGRFYSSVDFDPDSGISSLVATSGTGDIFIQKLNICSVNTGVTLVGATLTANAVSGTYAWMDCNTFSNVGVTTQSYTPAADGDFAVVITQGTCKDTSTCYSVVGVGLDELTTTTLEVYPNPTNSNLTIETTESINVISIYNSAGQLVQTEIKSSFSVVNLPAGIYFLQIQTENGISTARFVKE